MAYGSPPPYGTPAPETASSNTKAALPTDSKGITESAQVAAANTGAAISGAATSVANAVPTSTEELKQQLAQAKATIANMTSDQGLRQRKVGATGQESSKGISAGLTAQQQQANGVPVQIVAALCLLSFLLAYFFF